MKDPINTADIVAEITEAELLQAMENAQHVAIRVLPESAAGVIQQYHNARRMGDISVERHNEFIAGMLYGLSYAGVITDDQIVELMREHIIDEYIIADAVKWSKNK